MHRLYQSLFTGVMIITIFISIPGINIQFNPLVADMLSASQQDRWLDWIKALSGDIPIHTEAGESRIMTRSSMVMFENDGGISAFDYLLDELTQLGFKQGDDLQIHTYAFPYDERHSDRNWKNIILTFPGKDPALQEERVLLVAHLDSTSDQEQTLAPGADDNASGAAGLLEAAAVLRHYNFKRTIHLIWFSGEEQSRLGSQYFIKDFENWLPEVIGVINLDMFAFDKDGDRCFEIHTGQMAQSQQIGHWFAEVIQSYQLNLSFDLIDDDHAYQLSDHSPFWEQGVPAIFVLENFFYHADKTCGNADRNFNYHRTSDTITYINAETGFSILQAAFATIAHMAVPLDQCFSQPPIVSSIPIFDTLCLTWAAVDGAETYQIWRRNDGLRYFMGETQNAFWVLSEGRDENSTTYEVIARSSAGCQSQASSVLINNLLNQSNMSLPTASKYHAPD